MEYGSPNFPIGMPGQPALGLAGQAMAADEAHEQWHQDHPGEICNPKDFPATDYADMQHGDQVMHSIGGTFEAGASFIAGGK